MLKAWDRHLSMRRNQRVLFFMSEQSPVFEIAVKEYHMRYHKYKWRTISILSLLVVIATADDARSQFDCSRCSRPSTLGPSHRLPWNGQREIQPSQRMRTDSPPLRSTDGVPEVSSDRLNAVRFSPVPNEKLYFSPVESVVPAAKDRESIERTKSPSGTNPPKPGVTEKIGHRYSDPRVIRMLEQLTPQRVETFYREVSELIDERHLQPATYSRRVDNALDHLIRALDSPVFCGTAQVRGTTEQIGSFQEELQEMRQQLKIRNVQDAVAIMRDVQKRAARSIAMNPSAIGLEFLYGATDSLDQFSMLLPPEKSGGPSVGLRESVVGIGIEIESHPSGLKILKLLPDGPAAQADLRSGDIITHIDGREIKSLDLNRAADLIVGPVGAPVTVRAARGNRTGSVTLTRQKIALHSVSDVRIQDVSLGIGYLKLEQFADSTMREIDAALMNLHRQGMKSLILDLRGNPGGLLTTAIALSDRFLPGGTIVATRGRTPDDNTHETAHFGNTWTVPLVVLIDHNSASASEIFAAAIQDNHRGLIVGEKSYGKGTVQTLFPLQSVPAALRLTTAKFYSPDGREMAGTGVTPDISVSADATRSEGSDEVLNEALRQIVNPKTRIQSVPFRRSGDAGDESHTSA